jgi:ATP-dependent RNA helicase DDX49/DBP8
MGQKRKILTADDLLRRDDDGVLNKRIRLSADEAQSSDDEIQSTTVQVAERLVTKKTHLPASLPSRKRRTASTFSDLGVLTELQTTLFSMSITNPTEVQAACIPPLLSGR